MSELSKERQPGWYSEFERTYYVTRAFTVITADAGDQTLYVCDHCHCMLTETSVPYHFQAVHAVKRNDEDD